MAQRFYPVFPQHLDSTPSVYAGGFLYFYATGTTTPLDTYSNNTLATPNANPVVLNSAGRPSTAIFLQNLPYKVVLKDVNGAEIWTADPVSTTDFQSLCITKVGSGSPSGLVAGTAGSSGVLPTQYWDYTNSILYVCTTSGLAAAAGWTALNAASATPAVVTPQGYLSPSAIEKVISSDASAATAIYYYPDTGNLVPIWNGARHVPTEFSTLTLTLASQHALNTIYDVFVFSNNGVLTLATGPAWNVSTAGSGARGTGAGTTQLAPLGGYYVNAVSMTGRNGSTTYTIGANLATWLGSLFIDGTAGQVTCHRSWGQSRKWGVWNFYNRRPVYLKAGDSTASWPYNTATIRAANGDSANSLTVFQGLAEEFYTLAVKQTVTALIAAAGGSHTGVARVGIGWNSTTTMSGKNGVFGAVQDAANDITLHVSPVGESLQVPALGINTVTFNEFSTGTDATLTFFGGEDDMVLSAIWRA